MVSNNLHEWDAHLHTACTLSATVVDFFISLSYHAGQCWSDKFLQYDARSKLPVQLGWILTCSLCKGGRIGCQLIATLFKLFYFLFLLFSNFLLPKTEEKSCLVLKTMLIMSASWSQYMVRLTMIKNAVSTIIVINSFRLLGQRILQKVNAGDRQVA